MYVASHCARALKKGNCRSLPLSRWAGGRRPGTRARFRASNPCGTGRRSGCAGGLRWAPTACGAARPCRRGGLAGRSRTTLVGDIVHIDDCTPPGLPRGRPGGSPGVDGDFFVKVVFRVHETLVLHTQPDLPDLSWSNGNGVVDCCSDPTYHTRRGSGWRELRQLPQINLKHLANPN